MKTISHHVFALSAAVALMLASPAAVASSPAYEQGLEAARDYRYSEAMRHFSVAAEQGDRDAQRTLGLMLLYGERLYGREVTGDRERGKQWLRAAAAQGCEVSSSTLKALAKHHI